MILIDRHNIDEYNRKQCLEQKQYIDALFRGLQPNLQKEVECEPRARREAKKSTT